MIENKGYKVLARAVTERGRHLRSESRFPIKRLRSHERTYRSRAFSIELRKRALIRV